MLVPKRNIIFGFYPSQYSLAGCLSACLRELFVRLLTLSIVLALLSNFVSVVSADASAQLNEENELVMQLAAGGYTSEAPLILYHTPERTMLPLGEIADNLGLALTLDLDAFLIEGWRGSEENNFRIDLIREEFYLRGQLQPWNPQTRYANDGLDIYVDQQSLQRWLELRLKLDVPSLELIVDSDTPLPVLEKLAREKQRARMRQAQSEEVPEKFIRNHYEWLGEPQFDFLVGTDVEHLRGKSELRHNLVLQGRSDLAKHSMRTSFIDNDGDRDLRLTFSRSSKAPNEDLFLGFDHYEFGDLSGFSDSLLFSSVQGRGLHVQRGGKSLGQQGDTVTLEGDAPPNWEVELYRNGNLVEFAQTSRNGRYRFDDVAIYLGENIFDVRLYGPQGQFREDREIVSVGGAILKDGEWQYQTLALNRNKSLVESRLVANQPESDFMLSEASYGVNRNLSLRAGFSSMTPYGTTQSYDYWYGGLASSLAGVTSQLLFAQNNADGRGSSLSLKAKEFDTNINFDWLYFDGLISDRNADGSIKNQFNLRFSRSLLVGLPSALAFDIEFRETERVDGSKYSFVSQRFSTGWAGYQMANSLRYSHSDLVSHGSRLEGTLSATRKWLGWRYKGSLEYQLARTGRISAITFGTAHKFESGLGYSGSVSYAIEGEDTFTSDNTFTWDFENFSLSASTGFNTKGFQYVGASLTTSLGYDAHKKQHFFSAASNVNDATVSAQVFLDENGNGVRDEGEDPVPNVKFKGNSKWRNIQTDEQGLVTLRGIKHLEMQKLEVDERSIEDPFVKVSKGPEYIYTHSGSHVYAPVPLAMTSEVEGKLLFDNGAKVAPVTSVLVKLIDEKGEVRAIARSEYDGVFLFIDLLPGNYCAVVDEASVTRLGFKPTAPQCFDNFGGDGVLFLDTLNLERGDVHEAVN